MNIHQLKCFITLARTLNFSEAAKQLFLTQPSISRQIKCLESEVGLRLFDRSSRSVSLTPAGRCFYVDAQDMLEHMEQSLNRAWNAANNYSQNLEIAYSADGPLRMLPEVLDEYRRQAPHVFPRLHICDMAEIYSQLFMGRRDVVFAPSNEEIGEHMYFDLYTTGPACIMPKNHDLSGKSTVTAQDLCHYPLFICHQAQGFPVLRRLFHYLEINHEKKLLLSAESIPVIYEYVRAGYGLAVVPPLSEQASQNLTMIPFVYPEVHHYGAHCLPENKEAVRFCQITQNIVRGQGRILL